MFLKGTSLEFAFFEAKTPVKVISLFPTVKISASVSVTRKLNSLNSTVVNFAVDSNRLSTQLINKLGENRIDLNSFNKQNLTQSIDKMGIVLPAGICNIQAYTNGLGAIYKIEYPITIDNLTFYHSITIYIKDCKNPNVKNFTVVLASISSAPATTNEPSPLVLIAAGVCMIVAVSALGGAAFQPLISNLVSK